MIGISRATAFIEWLKIVSYEKKILKYFHSVIVLTERDQKLLRAFSPKADLLLYLQALI